MDSRLQNERDIRGRQANIRREVSNGAELFEANVNGADRYERHVLESGCPINAIEEVDITIPAYVRANTEIGNVCIRCMDSRVIKNCTDVIGRPNTISRFVIKQKLRVDIPVNCAVEAYVGEGHVHFDSMTDSLNTIESVQSDCGCE